MTGIKVMETYSLMHMYVCFSK